MTCQFNCLRACINSCSTSESSFEIDMQIDVSCKQCNKYNYKSIYIYTYIYIYILHKFCSLIKSILSQMHICSALDSFTHDTCASSNLAGCSRAHIVCSCVTVQCDQYPLRPRRPQPRSCWPKREHKLDTFPRASLLSWWLLG